MHAQYYKLLRPCTIIRTSVVRSFCIRLRFAHAPAVINYRAPPPREQRARRLDYVYHRAVGLFKVQTETQQFVRGEGKITFAVDIL